MSKRGRSDFRDPNQGTSWTPIVLILGLALGIPAILALIVGGVFFAISFFVVKAAGDLHEEVMDQAQKAHADARAHQEAIRLKQQKEIEAAKQGKKQPIIPPDWPNVKDGPDWQKPKIENKGEPRPVPPVGVPGKRMYDLIKVIDLKKDSESAGKWSLDNNVLRCNEGNFVPRVEIPYQPPQEYDFIVTFSQPGLRNGISLIMPNPNGGSFFFFLGSGDGSQFGFGAPPGQQAKEQRIPGLIQVNTACTATVQVRRNSVRALLDGKELMNFQTDYRDLGSDNWRRIRNTNLLAVACDDPTVFHFVQIVEITGAGRSVR